MLHGLSAAFLYSALSISSAFDGGAEVPGGTGFLVRTETCGICLVTNKHVILAMEKHGQENGLGKIRRIVIRGKSNEGELPSYSEDFVFDAYEWKVAYPSNDDDDIAVLYQLSGRRKGQAVYINRDMFATESYFEDESNLGVYDYVAVPGFHPGYDTATNRPLFRGGNISSDPRYGHSAQIDGGPYRYYKNLVVYETFAYPGSSGSPVFALQKGIRPGDGISFPAYRPARLIGIQSMTRYASSVDARVHSGLSYFVKSSAILELLDSIPRK